MSFAESQMQSPHDLGDFWNTDEWQTGISWPVPYHLTRQNIVENLSLFLRSISKIDEPLQRDTAILALPTMLGSIWWFQQMAIALQFGKNSNFGIGTENRGLNFLNGSSRDLEGVSALANRKRMIRPARPLSLLRRARITSRWAPIWKVPFNLACPQITVGSINQLLLDMVGKERRRIDYIFPETLYDQTKRQNLSIDERDSMQDLAGRLAAIFSNITDLDDHIRNRLSLLIETVIRDVLNDAARDRNAIKNVKKLPEEFWTGTGGGYLVRLIGMEIMNRGGNVVRFDHGSAGTTDIIETVVAIELLVSTQYVAPTKILAGLVTKLLDQGDWGKEPPVEIIWAEGDPAFKKIRINPDRACKSQPCVMYAPTVLYRDYQQFAPPLLPNPIYLDWQLRLAGAMTGQPIEFICKPHPEGYFTGQRHPLETVATTRYEPCESLWEEADIFIFDWCQSTAFWKALCTDRKVIVLDLGMTTFSPEVRAMIERRCEVLKVNFDERSRPILPLEALAAEFTKSNKPNDPTEFRELFIGDEFESAWA